MGVGPTLRALNRRWFHPPILGEAPDVSGRHADPDPNPQPRRPRRGFVIPTDRKGPPVLDLLLSLRGLLFIEGIAVMMLYAWIVGTKIADHGWSYRITALGILGTFGYVTAIQVKAYNRHSPFDAFSYARLVALSIVLVGHTLYLLTRTDTTDGK